MTDDKDALLRAATTVKEMLELGDGRLMAQDGPCGGQLPQLSPDEWGKVYRACKRIIKHSARITAALEGGKDGGWIPVGERLPTKKDSDANGNILFCRDRKRVGVMQWDTVRAGFGDDAWQPLPPLPTGDRHD